MPKAKVAASVARGARLRFGLLVGALVAFIVLTPREHVWTGLAPLDLLTAKATAHLLTRCGMEVHREAAVLSHPSGFAYEIYWRCTGLLPAGFLAIVILASPAPLSRRGLGVLWGMPLVLAVNLLRLASLFFIGVRYPAAFDVAHSLVWEGIVILAVLGVWLGWMRLAGARVAGRGQ